MYDRDEFEQPTSVATSLEIRQYPNDLVVEFFTAQLPFYIFGDNVNVVFTVGVPGGEYVIIGRQPDSVKVDQLDVAIRYYLVDKNPEYRDFFYDKEGKVKGSWTYVDAEEELAQILEWYQEHCPSGYFQPKQIFWADHENRLPNESGYSQGFDPQPILKAPSEAHGEILLKRVINNALNKDSFAIVGAYGEWKMPSEINKDFPLLYQTFGLIEFGIPELVYFSNYPSKVAEKFLTAIANQLIHNENPEHETDSHDAMSGVVLKEVEVAAVSEQRMKDWKKFFDHSLIRVNQVFEADNNDKYPEDDGYDWDKKPQPFFEDQ